MDKLIIKEVKNKKCDECESMLNVFRIRVKAEGEIEKGFYCDKCLVKILKETLGV